MASWREFVKEVQKKESCTYKEALKKASPLWKAKKEKDNHTTPEKKVRKKRTKRKKVESANEVVDFPKVKAKADKKRRKVPRTQKVPITNLGGSLIPQDKPKKLTKKQRYRKRKSVVYSSDAAGVAKLANI